MRGPVRGHQPRRVAVRGGAVVAVATLAVTAFGPVAAAAAGDASRAEGRFLDGTFAGQPFSTVAELEAAKAERTGDQPRVVSANDLSGRLLGQALPAQEGGLTVPLDQVVTLGAANQYAEASPRASSRAASGAVADSGAVNTAKSEEYPASVTFSLADVLAANGLPQELRGQVDLDVELRGLAAVAAHDAERDGDLATTCKNLSDPAQCRDYDLATAKATLSVPRLGDLLRSALDGANAGGITADSCAPITEQEAKDLCTRLAALGAQSPVGIRPTGFELDAVLDDVTTTSTRDGVDVDARAGTVTIDLAKLVERAINRKINDLPPNTDLAPYLAEALAEGPTLVASALSESLDAIVAQLERGGVVITAGGQETTLTGAQAAAALEPITEQLATSIETGAQSLTDQFSQLAEQLKAFEQIGSLVVNVQEEPSAGVYREVALRGTLLPGTPGEARLDLAAATVGANTIGGGDAAVPATPVGNPQEPGLPNTGAGTLDLPFLLLGLAFVTGGLWVVMWGRAEVVPEP